MMNKQTKLDSIKYNQSYVGINYSCSFFTKKKKKQSEAILSGRGIY